MAKKNAEPEILLESQPVNVEKELSFTKPDCAEMVKNSYQLIHSGEIKDKKELISLYGIYYNAFAGLVRSGVLCSREAGPDGMPEIVTMLDSKNYSVRESILLSIFGFESEYVVKPWTDNASKESYFNGTLMKDLMSKSHSGDVNALNEIARLKKTLNEKSSELDELQKQYNKLSDAPSGSYKDKLEELNKKHQKELDNVKIHAQRTISDLQNKLNQEKGEHDKYRKEAAAELADAKKYVYDPNYDHYYSDVLPKLVDSIEFAHTDIVIRGLCMGLSFIGILLSLVFVL